MGIGILKRLNKSNTQGSMSGTFLAAAYRRKIEKTVFGQGRGAGAVQYRITDLRQNAAEAASSNPAQEMSRSQWVGLFMP